MTSRNLIYVTWNIQQSHMNDNNISIVVSFVQFYHNTGGGYICENQREKRENSNHAGLTLCMIYDSC